MYRLFCLLILFGLGSFALGQKLLAKDSIQLFQKDTITDFTVDYAGNLYYITGFSKLRKRLLSNSGQRYETKEISFSNRTDLTNVNAQNALQITVKSMLFNMLILDNRLNQIQDPIQFPFGSNFTPTVSYLLDNNFLWGYDPVLQQLILWDYNNNQIFRESVILNNQEADAFYKSLIYHNNQVYLFSDDKILIFDQFANLISMIPFQAFKQVQINQNKIYYSKQSGQIFSYDLTTKEKLEIETSKKANLFDVQNQTIYVLNNQKVYLYQLKNN